jgi:signal transduction histidine kinase/CHASE3 domain sensor protein
VTTGYGAGDRVPSPTTESLRRQFTWLIVVLVVVAVVRLVGGQFALSWYESGQARIHAAREANQTILQLLTDAETGVRGYQLTGDPTFLEPYRRGVEGYDPALRTALSASNADGRRLLLAQDAAAQTWLTGFGRPVAAAPSGVAGFDKAQSARGKQLFDAIRVANAAVRDDLRIDEQEAADRFNLLANVLQGLLGLLAVGAILMVVRLAVRTSRMLLAPLTHLQGVLERLTEGDRDARATVDGPNEVRQLALTLNNSLDATARVEGELQTAHDAVERQNAYFVQVLDSLNMAVTACDEHGDLVYRNRVARRQRHDEAFHRSAGDAARTGDSRTETRHPVARALAGEVFVQQEMTFTRPGQPDRAVMVDARPLRDRQGLIIGAVASGYDVSVLRAREAELAAFAGIVAHDLKNPLAAIIGYAELVAEELNAGQLDLDAVRAMVARATASVYRMGDLIDDLLAYATARDKPLDVEPIDLGGLVHEIVTESVPQSGPVVVVGALPVVPGDAGMIRQLLMNLIGNAVKYTRPGEPAHVEVSAVATDEEVQLMVDDRGIGIPADERLAVFTAFHRAPTDRPYAGTGLGLAICQRVAERHGGSIAATDSPGGGTRMVVTLPLVGTPGPARRAERYAAAH